MKIYPYEIEDVSPDACRSTYGQRKVYLSHEPCITNMSHEERTEGWCGTTNNSSLTALGEFDSDDINGIESVLPSDALFDKDEYTRWLEAEFDDYNDFLIEIDYSRSSDSATWNPTDENDWFPTLKEEWNCIANEDNSDHNIEFLDKEAIDKLEDILQINNNDYCEITTEILDICEIPYDDIYEEIFNAGGYSGWRQINVHDNHLKSSQNILEFVNTILQTDIDFTREVFVSILKCLSLHIPPSCV